MAPVLTYQAHSSPIGWVFYTGEQFPAAYRNDVFVAMRGSWNRQQPVGYKLLWFIDESNVESLWTSWRADCTKRSRPN